MVLITLITHITRNKNLSCDKAAKARLPYRNNTCINKCAAYLVNT